MADENIVDQVVDTKVVQPVVKVEPVVAATPSEPAKPATVVDAPADKVVAAPADFPTDWREKASGGDAKKLSRLQRYASPQALADAFIAAQNKISSGELKSSLPANATTEQLKEWRASNGIPEAADKYDLKVEGVTITDADKPLIDKFVSSAHTANMTNDQVKSSLKAYYEINEAAAQNRLQADTQIRTATEDSLRAEWGQEYRRNINLVSSFLDSAPEGMKDKFFRGRLADGTPIGSSPEVLKWLTSLALERNPAGVVVPAGGVNMSQSVEEEISKIEKQMRTNRKEYDRDEKVQARYRELLTWREQQSKKAA